MTQRRPNTMRHTDHDYTASGAYFVTICVHDGQMLFGQIVDDVVQLSPLGAIAQRCLPLVFGHHVHIRLDVFVVMPNHVHILLWIVQPGVQPPAPGPQRAFAAPVAGSLSTLVGAYKAEVSRQAKRAGLAPAGPLWQRNFWDRIVRDDHELHNVRNYIQTNPQRWDLDRLHVGV
jgi:REP element-mobilizing transposase RayT